MSESNLVLHARRELELLGEEPEMVACLIAAVEGFASYPGHSGGSAACAIGMLERLLRFQNLAPLTDDPAEWQDQSGISGVPVWQNHRNSEAFSDDGGKTYWLLSDGIPGFGGPPRHASAKHE